MVGTQTGRVKPVLEGEGLLGSCLGISRANCQGTKGFGECPGANFPVWKYIGEMPGGKKFGEQLPVWENFHGNVRGKSSGQNVRISGRIRNYTL